MNVSRSRHAFGLLLVFVVTSYSAFAQAVPPAAEDLRPPIYVGVYVGYGLVNHDVLLHPDYFIRQPVYQSDKVFTSASGGGMILGGLIEYTLTSNFSVGLRLGYNTLGFKPGGDLLNFQYTNTTNLHQGKGADSVPVTGTVEADVDADLAYINATPHLKITPASLPIYAIGGLTILYPLSAAFEFNEQAVAPTGALFANNRALRKLGAGDIPNAKTMMGVTLGIGYDYPLTRKITLFGEGQYLIGMGDLVGQLRSDEKWKISALSGIIGIKIGLGGAPPPPPPPIVVKDTAIPVRDSLFHAVAVTPEGFSDTLVITGRKVQGTEVHALLPYIFFPRDSAVIPDRYVRVTKKERSAFSAERLPRGNTLGVYYNILNIVGQRIREKRKPRNSDGQAGAGKLQIVGCLSSLEGGDTALAMKRAEAVRDYLRNVWTVPAARMEVSVSAGPGGLPMVPTTSEVDSLEGERENQRVELYYERNAAILEPVELLDSAFLMPAGVIRFFPPPIDTSKVGAWTLDVTVGDVLDKDVKSGFGPPPDSIDYPIDIKPGQSFDQPVRVTGSFILRDTTYMEIGRRSSEAVMVRQEGTFEEQRNTVRGKYLDVFNLLLFHFDSTAVLAFSDEANAIMRDRIAPSSIIRVVGHTDRLGLPPYNRELSQRRAEVASQALGVPVQEVLGMGEKKLLYDNTFPEGRYYSRTVTVTVETPVADGDALRQRRATDPNASGGTDGGSE